MTVTRANHNALLGFFAAFGAGGLASLLLRYALQYSAKKAKPVRVLITGAAGQIGYALAPMIAAGGLLGPGQPVILHLLDIEPARVALEGVRMELVDGAFPLLHGVVASTDLEVAAKDVDVAIMVGGYPRRQGEERKDVMAKNVTIYKSQAVALDAHASKDVKVVVVANPANTNAFILKENAPGIPEQNITCLTRLDHNRALGQVAERLGVHVSEVQNVIIWGNHSSTQYPDVAHGTVAGVPIRTAIADPAWLDGEFITTVQQRGAAIIRARGLSSALSAAVAVCGHVHDWMVGTPPKQWVSMGVVSDGSYGITPGLVYSFPVTASKGKWKIVTGLEILPPARQKLRATEDELEEERKLAAECLDAEQKASTST